MVFQAKSGPLEHTDGDIEVSLLLKVGKNCVVLLLDSDADLLKSFISGDGFKCSFS